MGARPLLALLVAAGLAASEQAGAEGGGFLAGQAPDELSYICPTPPCRVLPMSAPKPYVPRQGGSHTVVTHETYGDVVKDAAWQALAGVVLVLLAFPVIWFNEKREVHMEQVFGYARSILKEAEPHNVDPSKEGCLVCMQGATATAETLTDPDFNSISVTNCAKLKKTVEMYQWVEHQSTDERNAPGGGKGTITTYSYDMQWVSSRVDSSQFDDKSYQNPYFPFQDTEKVATDLKLGVFSLTGKLISQMVRWQAETGPGKEIRANGKSFWQEGSDGVFMTNQTPQLGDMRVTFQKVECGPATVVALQHGSSFKALTYAMIPKGPNYWPCSGPPAKPQKVDLNQPLLGGGKGSAPMNPCSCIGLCIESGEELNELAEEHLSADEMMGRAEGAQKCYHLGLLFLGYLMFFGGFLLQFQFVPTLFRVIPWVGTWIQFFGNTFALVGALFCGCFWWSGTLAFSWLFARPIRAVLLFSLAIGMIAVPTVLSHGH